MGNTSNSKVKVYGYDENVDPSPRIAAIVMLVLYTLLLLGIVLEVAITRDWCVNCDTLKNREGNVDWGLFIFAGWLGAGLLHMIQSPGSKLGFIMTIVMSILVMAGAVIQNMSTWGRYVDCKNNTIAGDTEFCDQNYHNKKILLVNAILGLITGAFAIGTLILAAVWFSMRRKAGLFPEEMISMTVYPPPYMAGSQACYAPLPTPAMMTQTHFAPPTNAAVAIDMARMRAANSKMQ